VLTNRGQTARPGVNRPPKTYNDQGPYPGHRVSEGDCTTAQQLVNGTRRPLQVDDLGLSPGFDAEKALGSDVLVVVGREHDADAN